MGQFGGVQAKLKELVNPDIFVLGCICHSLHLCASEACKKIPSEAEEFVQDIYNYICRSPKRLKVYEEFQAFIDLKPHKLLRLSQTRWLSLEAVVKRILEKWQALKLYFTSEVIEEKDFMRPRQILDKFERPETEIYLSFLCYILPLINKLNLEFQSEKPKIHILFERIMTLYKTILKCFLKNNYVDRAKSINDINPLNVYEYLKNEEIYLGQQAESVLTKYNLRKDDIRNRFKNLSQYENFQLLNPNTVLERPTSITILIQQFKHFVKDNMEEIASECREISSLPNQIKIKLKELEFSAFWFELSSFKNSADQKVFGNIYQFVFNIMCLPHSSACAERIFSQLNLIKTKQRNRLLPETCNSLLMAKTLLDSNPCFVWAPETALLNEQIIYTSFVIRKRQKPEAEIEVSNNLSQPQPSTSATVDKPDELIKHTDDSDSDDNSDNKAAEKKKRKIYTQKFRDVWLKEFPWLKLLERGDKICVICNKSIQGGKSHLERHEKNLRHTILSKKVESSRNVAEMLKK
nr:unnamed protein product [Callosobruchus analis]